MACLRLAVLAVLGFVNLCLANPMKKYETLDARCEKLAIPMCSSLPYNMTRLPTLLGHETQKQARLEIESYIPLVKVNCSPDLLRFLCSLYAPICLPMAGQLRLLPPCRHNCWKVWKGCNPLVEKHGFKWPEPLKCSKFPEKKSSKMCFDWDPKAAKKAHWSIQKRNKRKNKGQSRKKDKDRVQKGRGQRKNGKDPSCGRGSKGGKQSKKNKRKKEKKRKNKKGRKGRGKKKDRCEKLAIPMCSSLPYNMTRLPTLLGHETQKQASLEIESYIPLVKVNCSPDFLWFLCSVYAPTCLPIGGQNRVLPPCRHNCWKAWKGCNPFVEKHGFKWPEPLKCSKFPEKKSSKMCFDWDPKAAKKAHWSIQKRNKRKNKGQSRKKDKDGVQKVRGQRKNGKDPSSGRGSKGGKQSKKNKRKKEKKRKNKKGRKGRGKKKDRN